jgi:hypothetical protein
MGYIMLSHVKQLAIFASCNNVGHQSYSTWHIFEDEIQLE